MKKLICVAALLMLLLPSFGYSQSNLRIMSYNVRNSESWDDWWDDFWNGTYREWDNRKGPMGNQIQAIAPDILGIQEAYNTQVNYIQNKLPNYDHFGISRDGEGKDEEHTSIFYNKNKFELITQETFWLHPGDITQKKKGWGADKLRICTWGIFKEINTDKKNSTGKRFLVMNTHLDHASEVARTEGAKLIYTQALEITKNDPMPIIIMGDFNSSINTDAYYVFNLCPKFKDTYYIANYKYPTTLTATANGFNPNQQYSVNAVLDYIFITNDFVVKQHNTDLTTFIKDGRKQVISDHFPIYVDFEWK